MRRIGFTARARGRRIVVTLSRHSRWIERQARRPDTARRVGFVNADGWRLFVAWRLAIIVCDDWRFREGSPRAEWVTVG